jgi:acetate kinase
MPDVLLTINDGSSSIKFAVYQPGQSPIKVLSGQIERIGASGTTLTVSGVDGAPAQKQPLLASNHDDATEQLIDWLQKRLGASPIAGIGHRIVHGGPRLLAHQLVTPRVVAELREIVSLDLAHLPREIALIEVLSGKYPGVPQVACFDTAFHHEMPRVAQLLPIPRRYDAAGVRRFGFHGLSYTYLMEELRRLNSDEANGRVILAHLGSGASMAAVHDGKPIDTTMAFTPTAGLVMGTRPGDIDPGLLVYLMRSENRSAEQMDEFINQQCGLLGVSETTSDMRDLIARRASDIRAAEAIALFCHQARKWIGALAATMGGMNTLVFAGGIGEHSAEVRAEICAGLEFLGLRLDADRNAQAADIISADHSPVTVRIIATDEELVIAKTVCTLLNLSAASSA